MIAVIIPTLNEEETIKSVIEKFPESYRNEKLEIYVIDGGSTDKTRKIAERSGAKVLRQRLSGGKGDGVREALEQIEASIYVMTDGDGTYEPEEIGKLLNPVLENEAEHVIGSRTRREKGAISKLNLFGNKIFNLITRLSTGKPIKDMLSGYRAFTHESLNHTAFTRPGFGIETEMTFSALENNVPMVEVPIKYSKRDINGESKLHPVKDGWRIVKTIIWSIRDLNPLKFFSVSALILLLLASYPAYLTVSQKLRTGFIQDLGPALFASVLIILGL
ncbi:MAG: TIGR04182 family glycosyltransferase, partial [Nanohaloarchaea archaeon QH_8_44_6]